MSSATSVSVSSCSRARVIGKQLNSLPSNSTLVVPFVYECENLDDSKSCTGVLVILVLGADDELGRKWQRNQNLEEDGKSCKSCCKRDELIWGPLFRLSSSARFLVSCLLWLLLNKTSNQLVVYSNSRQTQALGWRPWPSRHSLTDECICNKKQMKKWQKSKSSVHCLRLKKTLNKKGRTLVKSLRTETKK